MVRKVTYMVFGLMVLGNLTLLSAQAQQPGAPGGPPKTETKPKQDNKPKEAPKTEVKPKEAPKTDPKPKDEAKPKDEVSTVESDKNKPKETPKTEVKPKEETKPSPEIKPKPETKPKPALKPLNCPQVVVSAPYAWLKQAPKLASRTLSTAKKNEPLWQVDKVFQQGWGLYRRANGRRYWVHQSVLKCGTGLPYVARSTSVTKPSGDVPEVCLHILRCATDWAVPNPQKQKFSAMLSQVEEQLKSPFNQFSAKSLCFEYQKEALEVFPNCGFKFDVYR